MNDRTNNIKRITDDELSQVSGGEGVYYGSIEEKNGVPDTIKKEETEKKEKKKNERDYTSISINKIIR
ncbi:MAG: bacteriocin [Lachnospiraceae bacterium]|nr:bacteriocin [Lachnospiraceae bacterium]